MSKKRILLVFPDDSAATNGGLSTYRDEILSQYKHTEDFVFQEYLVPTHWSLPVSDRQIRSSRRLFEWADVVHAHDFLSGLHAIQMGAGGKTISTIHLLHQRYSYYPNLGLSLSEIKNLEDSVIRESAVVTAVSNSMAAEIRTIRGGNDSIPVVLNGYDTDLFPVLDRRDSSKQHIGFIGRLTEQKGADRLPRFISLFSDCSENAVFHIIGDGPLLPEIKRQIEGIAPRPTINIYNWVARNQLGAILRNLDFVVSFSRFEPFGLVYLESIGSGVPIVGRIVDGMWEYCQPEVNCWSLSDGDILGAEMPRISRTISNIARSTRAGISSSVSDFTWQNTSRRNLELYRRVA